jgi:acetyl esterase
VDNVDPQVRNILALVALANPRQYWQMSAPEARMWHDKKGSYFDVPPAPVHHVAPLPCPGPFELRLYSPRPSRDPLPVTLWIHGGGFVVGSLDSYDSVCRQLALQSDSLVVSVGYRLAPEHKFPAAVEDCLAAYRWVCENAGTFGGDPQRVALAGDSAGANLATVTAVLARDAGLPGARLQVLVYPCVAPHQDSASHHEYAEGYLLTRPTILWFMENYRRTPADCQDPRFAPLLFSDLAELPPTFLILAERDPLVDEGREYAELLRRHGNTVETREYPGMVHGFFNMGGHIDAGRQAVAEASAALRQAFASVSAPAARRRHGSHGARRTGAA